MVCKYLFKMYIFNWLLTDKDIDGDGKLSVMDSFKFASIYTNEALKDIKKKNNLQSIIEQSNLMSCIDKQDTDVYLLTRYLLHHIA